MFKLKTALAATLVLGTATIAFAYASDPDVQARQGAMQTIGSNLKKLVPMSQGKTPFDASVAQAAFADIAATAETVPVVFEPHAKDPESKASDAIWANWDDFTSKAANLKAAAEAGTGIDSLEALQQAMGPLAGACKACHTDYKL